MERISNANGLVFMQMLTEFYQRSHCAEKNKKPKTEHIKISDEYLKTEQTVRDSQLA
jgi:predicted nuclease of restriction endonuclease-like (RecB) superfamily